MKLISLGAFTALLGACTTTPSVPVGSAVFDTVSRDYTVTLNGATYTLSSSAPRVSSSEGSMAYWNWSTSGTLTSGFAFSSNPDYAVAAGLDSGTYFAGVSGNLSGAIPVGGEAFLSGGYAFVVNGVDQTGTMSITADFGAGTIVDTSAGIDIIGTISGGNISGTVIVAGEAGDLAGGFYIRGVEYRLVGAAVGANMAGIISAQ